MFTQTIVSKRNLGTRVCVTQVELERPDQYILAVLPNRYFFTAKFNRRIGHGLPICYYKSCLYQFVYLCINSIASNKSDMTLNN